MQRFKQKLIKGLTGFLLAGAFLFPKANAQERLIIDNFSQPNDSTLNWYGSGDINKDNTIDWNDVNRLDSLIKGSFQDTTDDRLLDRADINGDEIINDSDEQLLKDYLNKNIEHLPAYWNKLDSLEKTEWFEKMYKIDKTDTITSAKCYEFSLPFIINFHGFKSLANGVGPDFPYEFSKNNRFNIPVYTIGTTTTSGVAHSINGVLVGDNEFNFNSWYFLDVGDLSYVGDRKVNPGDWDMALNNNVEVEYMADMDSAIGGGIGDAKIIKWFLDGNANATLIETNYTQFVVPSNPNKDTIPPNINLSIKDSSYFNSNINLEYIVKENQTFLDSAYYNLDGNKTSFICGVPRGAGLIPTDSISGEIPVSKEGEHNFLFYVNDIAKPKGNEATKSIKFFIDKTAPDINIIYPKNDGRYMEKVDSMVFKISDPSLDSTWYSTDNGQTKHYVPAVSDSIEIISLNAQDKGNTWSIYAKDKAGNLNSSRIYFYVSPVAVKENKANKSFKAYPNPVHNIENFDFYLESPKNLQFSVYDVSGKLLEKIVFEGNQGENKINYDFSKYKSGIYIYKLGDKTGKIVKR